MPAELQNQATDTRKQSWFPIDNIVLDNFNLTAPQLALYVAIVRFANRKTGSAFPGQATLAARAGMAEKTVERHLPALEEKGLIKVIRTPGKAHHYIVLDTSDIELIPDTESEVDPNQPPSESRDTPDLESEVGDLESGPPPTESPTNKNHFNNNHHQDSSIKTPPATTPSDALDDAPGDDDELKIVEKALDALGMASQMRARVLALGSEYALALIWMAQANTTKSSPVGLLLTMIDRQQQPPDFLIHLARLALALGITDRDQAERERRAREMEAETDSTTHSPAKSSPEQTGDEDSGLDVRQHATATSIREAWPHVQHHAARLGKEVHEAMKHAQLGHCARGTLTIRAPHSAALAAHAHDIARLVRNLTSQSMQVQIEQ